MLAGGDIIRFNFDARGQTHAGLWSHLIYELEGQVTSMSLRELHTGTFMLEVKIDIEAQTEAKYYELIEERKSKLQEVLNIVVEQQVVITDFLKYSPIPKDRKRIGLKKPK